MCATEDGGRGGIGSLSRCSVSELGMRRGSGCVGTEGGMKVSSWPTCFSAQRLVSLKKQKNLRKHMRKADYKTKNGCLLFCFLCIYFCFNAVFLCIPVLLCGP